MRTFVDTVRRAIQRASALTANDLKKGVASLARPSARPRRSSGCSAPSSASSRPSRASRRPARAVSAPSRPHLEALVETALGLVVAIPAVWFYNYLTGRIEYFNVEMDNSSSELVDYFIKKTA